MAGRSPPSGGHLRTPAALQAADSSLIQPHRVDASALSQHLATQELVAPPPRAAGCRALLPTGAGPLLTGSTSGESMGVVLWGLLVGLVSVQSQQAPLAVWSRCRGLAWARFARTVRPAVSIH